MVKAVETLFKLLPALALFLLSQSPASLQAQASRREIYPWAHGAELVLCRVGNGKLESGLCQNHAFRSYASLLNARRTPGLAAVKRRADRICRRAKRELGSKRSQARCLNADRTRDGGVDTADLRVLLRSIGRKINSRQERNLNTIRYCWKEAGAGNTPSPAPVEPLTPGPLRGPTATPAPTASRPWVATIAPRPSFTATPTDTAASTSTAGPTIAATMTATSTATPTRTYTPTPSATVTPTATFTRTAAPAVTLTRTPTLTPPPTLTPRPTVTLTPTAPSADISQALGEVSEGELTSNLYYLAGPELSGRKAGTTGGRLAREFIAGKFADCGLLPWNASSYYQPFPSDAGDTENVIGIFPGQDPSLREQAIVVGAHFDHTGPESDGVHYGADDNASGTVAMLEIARTLSILRSRLKRSVVFVAFDAEELWELGSQYYVQHPALPPLGNTIYMINLDQTGWLSTRGHLIAAWADSWPFALTAMLGIAPRYPQLVPLDTGGHLTNSDHDPFRWSGVPVVFLTTGTEGTYYHTRYDTADRIDYDGVVDITKFGLELVWQCAQH